MAEELSIFECESYKTYLKLRVGGKRRTGTKAAMAKALDCQPTYISQVLHGAAHLSPEQADRANNFFAHSREEAEYFLILVMHDRAGTESLRQFLKAQLQKLRDRRLVLVQRLGGSNPLSEEQRSIYYSSWLYGAVHMALTIPGLRQRELIAKNLGLPFEKVQQVLDFLEAVGLAAKKGDEYQPGPAQIRLGNDTHHILKHHMNWRIQAMEALDREALGDLHYSACVSLSRNDIPRLKDRLLKEINAFIETVKASQEEELCALTIDFFNLRC